MVEQVPEKPVVAGSWPQSSPCVVHAAHDEPTAHEAAGGHATPSHGAMTKPWVPAVGSASPTMLVAVGTTSQKPTFFGATSRKRPGGGGGPLAFGGGVGALHATWGTEGRGRRAQYE